MQDPLARQAAAGTCESGPHTPLPAAAYPAVKATAIVLVAVALDVAAVLVRGWFIERAYQRRERQLDDLERSISR